MHAAIISKRKAISQGGRRYSSTFTEYFDDSSEEEATTSKRSHEYHVHISATSSQAQAAPSTRRSTVMTVASPSKGSWGRGVSSIEADMQGFFDSEQSQFGNTGQDPSYMHRLDDLSRDEKAVPPKPPSREPLRQWLPHRERFLDQLIFLEGRGELGPIIQCQDPQTHGCMGTCLKCRACDSPTRRAVYRCRDCFGGQLFCQECLLLTHGRNPLHRIEHWGGRFFTRTTLKSLGLRIQLGHGGRSCVNPEPSDKHFLVIDTHGIQHVSLDFCGCDMADLHDMQLLRAHYFPATVVNPSTVATFRCLEHLHQASLQSKTSTYHFYNTLERLTDNTDLKTPPDRYEELLRMAREWRHLKQLKRGGRGHVPDGIQTTRHGELAIICPACPHPGINLPAGWEDAPPDLKWLYRLLISLDANFRMRRKAISSDAADPPLANGWLYFVELEGYKKHLGAYQTQKDISTCSNLAAIGQANTRGHKGLATTGVGACVCARHQMVRPNGIVDLQRGERYCNMDYAFFSAIRGEKVHELVVSYDIACQWYKNLEARMHEMPSHLQREVNGAVTRFLIPKFHLPSHGSDCHSLFSFNLAEGVGRTDGEGIERDWSIINPVSRSTKEMAPGHRTDTLNDHWADLNWRKVCGMGRALARKIRAAIPERTKHVGLFKAMSDSLPSIRVEEWVDMVGAWEAEMRVNLPRDVTVINPYVVASAELTQADVRLKLAQADTEHAAASRISMHEVSPAQFIITGLELQEHQHRILEDRPDLINGTSTQRASLQERRNILQRKITAWEYIQAIYMPGVPQMRTDSQRRVDGSGARSAIAEEAEERALFLPSQVPRRDDIILPAAPLRPIELQLREAQAHDALHEIRHYLRLLSFLWKNKNKNDRGQKENTRSQTLIKRVVAKKNSSVRRYRRARESLQALEPDGTWSRALLTLTDGDVRGLMDPGGSETEGRRSVSWIWTIQGVATGSEADDVDLHDSLRIEWCKARARARRWTEEIQLLREEMRRVLETLDWKAQWWRERAQLRSGLSPPLEEGIRAYAARQATLQADLKADFAQTWNAAEAWADKELLAVGEGQQSAV